MNYSNEEKIKFLSNPDNKKTLFDVEDAELIEKFINTLDKDLVDVLFDSIGCSLLTYQKPVVQKRWIKAMMKSNNKDLFLENDLVILYLLDFINKGNKIKIEANINNKHLLNFILKHYPVNNINLFSELALMFDEESRQYLLDKYPLSRKLNNVNLDFSKPKSVEWIINNFEIDLTTLSFYDLLNLSDCDIEIPHYMLENRRFMYRLAEATDIAVVRSIVNGLARNNDVSHIEKYLEKRIDMKLSQFNEEEGMLENFFRFFNDYPSKKFNSTIIDKLVDKYFGEPNNRLKDKLTNYAYYFGDSKELKKRIKKESDECLSNMILDYHFKDVYYDVLININELVRFQSTKVTLPLEKLNIYKRILSIDSLTYHEKMNLHNGLKNYDMVSMLYDDMFACKQVVHEMVKDSILDKDKLKKFRDKALSDFYDIDIYILDGKEFYALAKTGDHHDKKEPFARSYSLLGPNATSVYAWGGHNSSSFLYEGVNSDQIVHMFPDDSFSRYDRDKGSTGRINVLESPKELTENTNYYNEILILEKGTSKSDMDEKIPELKKLALYTYDEIKNKDIEVAKKNDVGIVLVKRTKYNSANKQIDYDALKYYEANTEHNLDNMRASIRRG